MPEQKQVHDPATQLQVSDAKEAVEFVEALVEAAPIPVKPKMVCLQFDDAENIYKIMRASSGVIKFGRKGRDSFMRLRALVTDLPVPG